MTNKFFLLQELERNLAMMMVFKTVDTRGLSFFNALNLATKAFKEVKVDGMLELIMDKKKDFTDAFKQWASSKGHKVSDRSGVDDALIRLFIKKVSRSKANFSKM